MRTFLFARSYRTAAMLLTSALAVVVLAGCPGAEDAASTDADNAKGGGEFGASGGGEGPDAGDGGAAGNVAGAPPGDAGSGGSGGTAAGGFSGSDNNDPSAGGAGAEATASGFPCVGLYGENAIWPAAGRCSARQGSTDFAGPTSFSALRSVSLLGPITTSPVIAANGAVWVANGRGLWRLDPDLSEQPTAPFDANPSESTPVVRADGSVLFLANDGVLRLCKEGSACTPVLFDPASDDQGAKGWKSDLALDPKGDVWFTSPSGRLYRVTPGAAGGGTPTKSFGLPVPNTEIPVIPRATSAVTISPTGNVFFGTSLGLGTLVNAESEVVVVPSAQVSHYPVFVEGRGAVYADDVGVIHSVRIEEDGSLASVIGAQTVAGAPGSFAVLGGEAPMVFLGVGSKLQVLSTTDDGANVDNSLDYLLATGPIIAPAATDSSQQIFVPSTDGNLYFVKPTLDKDPFVTKDSYLTEGSLEAGAALAAHRVYFGSTDGSLYLIVDETVDLTPVVEPSP
jgi:streptogramin lyase